MRRTSRPCRRDRTPRGLSAVSSTPPAPATSRASSSVVARSCGSVGWERSTRTMFEGARRHSLHGRSRELPCRCRQAHAHEGGAPEGMGDRARQAQATTRGYRMRGGTLNVPVRRQTRSLLAPLLAVVLLAAACQTPASTSPTTTAGTGGAQATAQGPKVKVAWIFEGVINDASFTQHQFESMKYLESKMPVENTYAEKVTPADAPRAMRDYINSGYKIIYAASGTYVSAAVQTAKDFPTTTFVVYGGAPIPNVTPN